MKPTFIALFSVCLFLPVTAADKITVPLWQFETGDQVVSSPAIGSDGTVYVGSNDKKLYALNLKHGAEMAAKEVKAHMVPLEKLRKLPDGKKTFTTVKGIYLGMNIYRAADVLNSKDSKLKLKVGAPAAKSPGLAGLNPLMFLTGPKKETPMKDRRIIVEKNGVYLEAGLDAQITIIRFSRTACNRLFDAAGLSNEKFYEEFSKAYRVGTSRFFSESNRVGITDLNLSESGRIYENSKEGYRVRFVFNRSYRDTTGNSQSITRGMNRDAKDKDWLNIEKTRKSKFGD